MHAAEAIAVAEAEFAHAKFTFEKSGLAALLLRGLIAQTGLAEILEMKESVAKSLEEDWAAGAELFGAFEALQTFV